MASAFRPYLSGMHLIVGKMWCFSQKVIQVPLVFLITLRDFIDKSQEMPK